MGSWPLAPKLTGSRTGINGAEAAVRVFNRRWVADRGRSQTNLHGGGDR
jgi:hypothetical protein